MKQPIPSQPARRTRRTAGRAQDTGIDDPYQARHKPAEPSTCSECGAVFKGGRWSWSDRLAEAVTTICPACHRIRDNYPAGIVTLSGPFLGKHKEEILNLARHNESLEKQDHPLNRIMRIEEQGREIVISTTDVHLPRRIGEALHKAYQGDLAVQYDRDSYFIRVGWSRME